MKSELSIFVGREEVKCSSFLCAIRHSGSHFRHGAFDAEACGLDGGMVMASMRVWCDSSFKWIGVRGLVSTVRSGRSGVCVGVLDVVVGHTCEWFGMKRSPVSIGGEGLHFKSGGASCLLFWQAIDFYPHNFGSFGSQIHRFNRLFTEGDRICPFEAVVYAVVNCGEAFNSFLVDFVAKCGISFVIYNSVSGSHVLVVHSSSTKGICCGRRQWQVRFEALIIPQHCAWKIVFFKGRPDQPGRTGVDRLNLINLPNKRHCSEKRWCDPSTLEELVAASMPGPCLMEQQRNLH